MRGKRLTRRQKIRVKEVRLNPDNWLLKSEDKTGLMLLHRATGKTRFIPAATK